jgi:hypothetical protein
MTEDYTTLIHEDGENYRSDKVSVNYDGRVRTLEVQEDGSVEARNRTEVEQLVNGHGGFFKINEEEETGHVLSDKTVDEVREYVDSVTSVDRLVELRELEDRKTAKDAIDNRISEVKDNGSEEEAE